MIVFVCELPICNSLLYFFNATRSALLVSFNSRQLLPVLSKQKKIAFIFSDCCSLEIHLLASYISADGSLCQTFRTGWRPWQWNQSLKSRQGVVFKQLIIAVHLHETMFRAQYVWLCEFDANYVFFAALLCIFADRHLFQTHLIPIKSHRLILTMTCVDLSPSIWTPSLFLVYWISYQLPFTHQRSSHNFWNIIEAFASNSLPWDSQKHALNHLVYLGANFKAAIFMWCKGNVVQR